LANLISSRSHPFIIIDARFDYEFKAGHIKGAFNIDNQDALERLLMHDLEKLRSLMQENTIIVFHCEFSEKRAPTLWQSMRNFDRTINMKNKNYTEDGLRIFFPEMYLLEKGFSGFYQKYPDLCVG
jgi:3-mercaptopyruvate sulfurtransferase SseA